MAFLQLSSNNPKFSYILKKNPNSGMLIKSNRKGRLFGWYTNPERYNIYFRDSDVEVSYSQDDFEYMDDSRYNAPMFLVNAFHSFLNHIRKADDNDIVGYDNILMINQMKCKPHSIEAFKSHFPEYEFSFEEVAFHNYKIEIKTKNTIRELVNLSQVLAIFNALLNNDLYITDDEIDKYLACLLVVSAPYFIRHLFKCYFLRTQSLFYKYKTLLETSSKEKLEFEFGNNLVQRTNFITKHMDFKSNIIDIGCGEGHYVGEFAPKIDKNGLEYHAIDINPERIENVKRLCERRKIENVATWSSIDEFTCPDNSVIIMTEVIEHMTEDNAEILIKKILKWPFKSLIVTTPNKEFNHNYQLFEEEVRHEDHKLEFSKEDFVSLIKGLVNNGNNSNNNNDDTCINNRIVEFFDIGDKVNNLKPTLAAIVNSVDVK
jgi:SAM-dependent methyltransferase